MRANSFVLKWPAGLFLSLALGMGLFYFQPVIGRGEQASETLANPSVIRSLFFLLARPAPSFDHSEDSSAGHRARSSSEGSFSLLPSAVMTDRYPENSGSASSAHSHRVSWNMLKAHATVRVSVNSVPQPTGFVQAMAPDFRVVPPTLLRADAPVYPRAARKEGKEGVVRLRLSVGEGGNVETVEMMASSGFPLLDEAAKVAATQWQFDPARRVSVSGSAEERREAFDGETLQAWYEVPIRFQLDS